MYGVEFTCCIFFGLLINSISTFEQCIEPCLVYSNGTTLVLRGTKSKEWEKFNVPGDLANNIGPTGFLYKENRILWYSVAKRNIIISSITSNAQVSIIPTATGTLRIGNLVDFTIDWIHELIYWTDDVYDSIGAVTLEGIYQSVVHHVSKPSLIEYSSYNNGIYLLFVSNVGFSYYIKRIIPGKSSVETLASTNQQIISIAVDYDTQRIYYVYTDSSFIKSRVSSVGYSGGTATFHYETSGTIHNLVQLYKGDQIYLYFIRDQKSVKKVQISDSTARWDWKINNVTTLDVDQTTINDILIVIQDGIQASENDNCLAVGCAQICFYAKSSTTEFSCGCQLGYELNSDLKTCRKAEVDAILYTLYSPPPTTITTTAATIAPKLVKHNVLSNYIVDDEESFVVQNSFLPDKEIMMSKMDIGGGSVYFVDSVNSWLCKADIVTGEVTILKTSFKYADAWKIKYDYISHLLLLVSSSKNEIAISNEDGYTRTLVAFDVKIQDLVLIPLRKLAKSEKSHWERGWLLRMFSDDESSRFVCNKSSKRVNSMFGVLLKYHSQSTIKVFNLDGNIKHTKALPNFATSFTYHENNNRIYWYNSHTKVIHDWKLGSSNTNVFLNNVEDVKMMFSGFGKYVYFVVATTNEVYRFMGKDNAISELVQKLSSAVDLDNVAVQLKMEESGHECTVDNGGCSHFCLRSKGSTTAKCACPEETTLNGKICDGGDKLICEHKSDEIRCEAGKVIRAVSATYGRLENSICLPYNRESWDCVSETSLSVVKNKCDGEISCSLSASNSWFGDPCPGIQKYLNVKYQCVDAADTCDAPNCLYYIQDGSLKRKSTITSTSPSFTIISGLNGVIDAIASDENENIMFWLSNNFVYRSTLRATLIYKLSEINTFGTPNSIAVDRINGLIYWCDSRQNEIYVTDYDGTKTAALMVQAWNPSQVVIDEKNRILFWINNGVDKISISRMSLSSMDDTNNFVLSIQKLICIAIDRELKRIFYQNDTGVFEMGYDGQFKKTLYSGNLSKKIVMQPHRGLIYLPKDVLAAYSYNGATTRQLSDDIAIPGGISQSNAFMFSSVVPEATLSCNQSACGERGICTASGNCFCFVGASKINDVQTCTESGMTSYTIAMIQEKNVILYDVYANGFKKTDVQLPSTLLQNIKITSVAHGISEEDVVYLYDKNSRSILQYNLDSQYYEIIGYFPKASVVDSLAYDYIGGIFFAIYNGSIYQSNKYGEPMVTKVLGNSRWIQYVVVDPRKRMLYYISKNSIFRSDYTGMNEQLVLQLDSPVLAFAADIYKDRLYWVQNQKIHSCLQDGTNYFVLNDITELIPTGYFYPSTFTDMKVTNLHVYLYDGKLGAVYRLDKFTGNLMDRIATVGSFELASPAFLVVREKRLGTIIIPENQDTYVQRFLFSYISAADAAVASPSCSTTIEKCQQQGTPSKPPACPDGYVLEKDTHASCGKCDEKIGNETVCACSNIASCAHRWNVRNVKCETQNPWLRMAARVCQKVVRSGFCPYYGCEPNGSYANQCAWDSDCTGSRKCCSTSCGRKCLTKTIQATSQCDVNNGGCSHVCIADQSNAAMCKCPDGMRMNTDERTCAYYGGYCDTQRPCSDSQICAEHSTTFQCLQIVCSATTCFNGGTCEDNNGNVVCTCPASFTGKFCEAVINPCLSSPCKNGGNCADDNGNVVCTCPARFTGKFCEDVINPCLSSPCKNGGNCADNNGNVVCTCPASFTGKFCEDVINPCLSSPCQNGGNCADNNGNLVCTCLASFTGKFCEDAINPCLSSPCKNGGNCADDNGNVVCTCPASFTGKFCKDAINPCLSSPCQNGGNCADDNGNVVCTCLASFTGKFCEDAISPCLSSPCKNGGNCADDNGNVVCTCLASFTGKFCEDAIDPCLSSPCKNSATCNAVSSNSRGYVCTCAVGYTGSFCKSRIASCNETSCQNGGNCLLDNNLEAYKCFCPNEYSGASCQNLIQVDQCSTNPCKNNKVCSPDKLGNPVCTCPENYGGKNCENKTERQCVTLQCRNEGACVVDDNGMERCLCPTMKTGKECEINTEMCHSETCQNGGTCQDLSGGFQCHCSIHYIGKRCEDPHPCYDVPCLNGGLCAVMNESYSCLCKQFYTGVHCELYFEDNIVSAILKQKSGEPPITKTAFKRGMALVYTEYCSIHDCFEVLATTQSSQQQYRRKRENGVVTFEPKHVVVVQGYPKELGTGETQVLYTVLIPNHVATKKQVFVTTTALINGVETSTVIIQNELGAAVTSAEKYSTASAPSEAPKEKDTPLVLIGAGAGGGTAVLIVLIITVGCICVKRRGGNKNLEIQMTDRNGRLSVITAKLTDNKHQSIDLDARYTSSDQIVTPFNRATIGLAPPPPDYMQHDASVPDSYEGIDDYLKFTSDDETYLEVSNINSDTPHSSSKGSFALDPESVALEREKSRALSNDTIYSSLDMTTEQDGADAYETLKVKVL